MDLSFINWNLPIQFSGYMRDVKDFEILAKIRPGLIELGVKINPYNALPQSIELLFSNG